MSEQEKAQLYEWVMSASDPVGLMHAAEHVVLIIDHSERGRAMLAGMVEDNAAFQDTVDDFDERGFQFLVSLTSNWTTDAYIIMAANEAALVEMALPEIARKIRSGPRAEGKTALAFAVEDGMEQRLGRSIHGAGVVPTHPTPDLLQ